MISNPLGWRLKMQWLVISDPSQNALRMGEWLERGGRRVRAMLFRFGRSVPRFVCAAIRMLRPCWARKNTPTYPITFTV